MKIIKWTLELETLYDTNLTPMFQFVYYYDDVLQWSKYLTMMSFYVLFLILGFLQSYKNSRHCVLPVINRLKSIVLIVSFVRYCIVASALFYLKYVQVVSNASLEHRQSFIRGSMLRATSYISLVISRVKQTE